MVYYICCVLYIIGGGPTYIIYYIGSGPSFNIFFTVISSLIFKRASYFISLCFVCQFLLYKVTSYSNKSSGLNSTILPSELYTSRSIKWNGNTHHSLHRNPSWDLAWGGHAVCLKYVYATSHVFFFCQRQYVIKLRF